MYSKEELVELQKYFSKWHSKVLVLVLVYLFVDIIRSLTFNTAVYSRGIIICILFIVELLFRFKNYFSSTKVIFGVKYFQIFALSVLIMNPEYEYFEYILCVALHFVIAVEMSAFFDTTEKPRVMLHGIFVILPILVAGIIYTLKVGNITYLLSCLLVLGVELVAVYGFVSYMGMRNNGFIRAIFAKERIIDKAMDKNRDIVEKQQKLFYVNEQLGIKRIQLEAANKKINDNIIEMNLQNDMLKYFTSTFDVGEINDYFSNKLITDMNMVCAGILKFKESKDYASKNHLYDFIDTFKMYGDVSSKYADEELADIFMEKCFSDASEEGVYMCNNVDYSKYKFLAEHMIRSFIVYKVVVNDLCIGIYFVGHKEQDFFAERKTYFENIFRQFHVVIENAFHYMQYEDMAKKDGLTGLFNRRLLNQDMERYRTNTSNSYSGNVVLAIFDIDNFKRINDTYGHLFGDVVIIALAEELRKIGNRENAGCYRYGGEEFVIWFSNSTLEEALPKIQEIHQNVIKREISDSGYSVHINTSVGVSSYPEICKNPLMIIDAADKALYESKTTGKGKITVDGFYPVSTT